MRRWRSSLCATVRMMWRRAGGQVVIVDGFGRSVGGVGVGVGCGCGGLGVWI